MLWIALSIFCIIIIISSSSSCSSSSSSSSSSCCCCCCVFLLHIMYRKIDKENFTYKCMYTYSFFIVYSI